MLERVPLAAALLLSASGCITFKTMTLNLKVADTAQVAIVDDSGKELLPVGNAPAQATLREGVLEEGPERAKFKLVATRDAGGGIVLGWDTRVAITNANEIVAFDDSGRFLETFTTPLLVSDPAEIESPPVTLRQFLSPDRTRLRFPVCAGMTSAKGGYRTSLTQTCGSDKGDVPLVFETPWSNVVELRKHYDEMGSPTTDPRFDLWLYPRHPSTDKVAAVPLAGPS